MRYRFADCVLDTERCELRRGAELVPIRAKVLRLLTYLITHAERVVSKEELLQAVWAGRVVGDATLNSCVKEARRAVGDDGLRQQVVRTFHGLGYRFVAGLERVAAEPGAPAVAHVRAAPERAPPVADAEPDRGQQVEQREHKQASVLSCAIVDPEQWLTGLDAETFDGWLRDFFQRGGELVARYGGVITERRGDGFTAVFGAPSALEDHARCAALAAVELRAGPQLRFDAPLRIGVASGPVVAGRSEHAGPSATGAPVLAARRMRDRAAPGEVLIAAACHELIDAEFASEPVADGVHRLLQVARERSGVPQRGGRTRSRFVGRARELAILRDRLQLAVAGVGQSVCLVGDPGIGKSRLLDVFLGEVAGAPIGVLQAHCLPYRRATPYYPLVRLTRSLCGVDEHVDAAVAQRRLDRTFRQARLSAPDCDLLLEFLDAAPAGARSVFDPETSRQRVFALLGALIRQRASRQPTVVALEDLHWIDSTSEQWLAGFVPGLMDVPVLLVTTLRPHYRPRWTLHSSVTRLAVTRLNDADSAALVSSLAAGWDSPALQRRVVSHAQGNPFFLEELTSSFLQTGSAPPEVPATIQAVLAARIDVLDADAKALLQAASVIGTPVDLDLLRAVSGRGEDALDASLAKLEDAELLFRVQSPAAVSLQFKHALTEEVAYASLLGHDRCALHARIAPLYEERLPDLARQHPELVADHYQAAGLPREALERWEAAGERAAKRAANPEALQHFRRALACLAEADVEAAGRRRLDILLRLGPPLMACQAFSAEEVEANYREAERLAAALGDDRRRFAALWGRWLHHTHRGATAASRRLCDDILELAADLDERDCVLQAHHAGWSTGLWHGDLSECRRHAMEGIRLYDRKRHHPMARLYGGHDAGVCAHGAAANTTWFLGRPDEALRLARGGAELAKRLRHPYTQLISDNDFLLLHQVRGDAATTAAWAARDREACARLGVPNYFAVATIYGGWAAVMQGDTARGFAALEEGLTRYADLGAERLLTRYRMLLAEACLHAQRPEQGFTAIALASELCERTGEIRWRAEIMRLQAELEAVAEPPGDAATGARLEQALTLAREQQNRAFELRAATSLAAWRAARGEPETARALLSPLYHRFSEGHDTLDLRRARALLERLPPAPDHSPASASLRRHRRRR